MLAKLVKLLSAMILFCFVVAPVFMKSFLLWHLFMQLLYIMVWNTIFFTCSHNLKSIEFYFIYHIYYLNLVFTSLLCFRQKRFFFPSCGRLTFLFFLKMCSYNHVFVSYSYLSLFLYTHIFIHKIIIYFSPLYLSTLLSISILLFT